MDQTATAPRSGGQAPAYAADERRVPSTSTAIRTDPVLAGLIDYGEG